MAAELSSKRSTTLARCLVALTAPLCGEHARRLLQGLRLRAKPVKECCTRRPLPVFPVKPEARKVLGGLLAACGGLVELAETVCSIVEEWEPPTSYTVIGSVAVISLAKKSVEEARRAAEEILHHAPGIEAVYGKLETTGEYRAQKLVHLAGKRVEETVYVEHGLRYPVRLGKVYVNPRLATEHRRIADMVTPGERVLDMFAGIGGFSLLIASTGKPSLVVANDVNPYAVEAMARAVAANKSKIKSRLIIVSADASTLPEILRPGYNRVIMNLPHTAKEYLWVAERLCAERCVIHLYTVARTEEEAVEGLPSWARVTRVQPVLEYAPGKLVYRVDILRLVDNKYG